MKAGQFERVREAYIRAYPRLGAIRLETPNYPRKFAQAATHLAVPKDVTIGQMYQLCNIADGLDEVR